MTRALLFPSVVSGTPGRIRARRSHTRPSRGAIPTGARAGRAGHPGRSGYVQRSVVAERWSTADAEQPGTRSLHVSGLVNLHRPASTHRLAVRVSSLKGHRHVSTPSTSDRTPEPSRVHPLVACRDAAALRTVPTRCCPPYRPIQGGLAAAGRAGSALGPIVAEKTPHPNLESPRMGKGGGAMNGARLTRQVVDAVEGLMDAWDKALADQVITPAEIIDLAERKEQVYALSQDADEAVGLTVTMLRRGPDSVSLKRRMVERGLRIARTEQPEQGAA